MIDRFFEYLINKLYWEFRKENNLPFGTFNPEPVIRFGGFDLEEPYQEIKGGHGKKHDEYVGKLRKLLENFPEYQQLKKFWK